MNPDASIGTTLALAGLVAAVLGLATAPLCAAVVRRLVPGRNVVFVRWGFSHVLLAIVTGVTALAVTTLFPAPAKFDALVEVLRSVVVLGSVAALVAFVAERLDPLGDRSLGLWPGGQLRAVGVALLAYAWFLPAVFGLGFTWPWILERLGESHELQAMLTALPELGTGGLVVFVLCTVVIVPLFEEVVFRGFLQPLLVQNLNDTAGVVMTSLVFAMLHGTSAFLPIFALSLVLGAVMLRTQRLVAVWAVHALHNGVTLALFLAAGEAVGSA